MSGFELEYQFFIRCNYDGHGAIHVAECLGIYNHDPWCGNDWSKEFKLRTRLMPEPLQGTIYYQLKHFDIKIPSARPDLYVVLQEGIPKLLDIHVSDLKITWYLKMDGRLTIPFDKEEFWKQMTIEPFHYQKYGYTRKTAECRTKYLNYRNPDYFLRVHEEGGIWIPYTDIRNLDDLNTVQSNIRDTCNLIVSRLSPTNPTACTKVDNTIEPLLIGM